MRAVPVCPNRFSRRRSSLWRRNPGSFVIGGGQSVRNGGRAHPESLRLSTTPPARQPVRRHPRHHPMSAWTDNRSHLRSGRYAPRRPRQTKRAASLHARDPHCKSHRAVLAFRIAQRPESGDIRSPSAPRRPAVRIASASTPFRSPAVSSTDIYSFSARYDTAYCRRDAGRRQ